MTTRERLESLDVLRPSAVRAGVAYARVVFSKHGNHAAVKLSEFDLAATIATAIEAYATTHRMKAR